MRKSPNPQLTDEQKDFILLLTCIKPHLSWDQMMSLFEDRFNSPITKKQLETLLKKIRPLIEQTKCSEELTLELAKKVGLITLSSKVNRVMMLEDIAKKSVEGDPHEVQTAKGAVVTLNKKDFNIAIAAIKAIRDEVGNNEVSANYTISITESFPPNHEDYRTLEGDDDL